MAPDLQDPFLVKRLGRRLPGPAAGKIEEFLGDIERQRTTLDGLAAQADANRPTLTSFDRWGERVDDVVLHASYHSLGDLAYGRFGLVNMAYDPAARQEWEGYPRSVAMAGGMTFAMSEQGLFCPLCMTDGAALVLTRALESVRSDSPATARWRTYIARLTSRGADRWSGAMFLTERQGGSDVGANTCTAVEDGGVWRLHGEKWFCSNAGADLALVLARPAGAPDGTRGLALFAMPRTLDDGTRNPYVIRRLKDKLGTRSMATGEVELNGAAAYLIGGADRGFAQMAEMINLSRLYNAVGSVAILARAYTESAAWAADRNAFGRRIADFPLVRDTLVQMAAETDGAQALVWEIVGRMDRAAEGREGETDRRLIRILTPLAKLYTAKRAVWAASEAIEILGGNGYVEEFITSRLLRDAQVLPIWEGTTNIQTLDVFRALGKEAGEEVLFSLLRQCLDAAPREGQPIASRLREHVDELESALAGLRGHEDDAWTVGGRQWAFKLAPAACASILVGESAVAEGPDRSELLAHAEKLVDMHLEGWTAIGLLRALDRRRAKVHVVPAST
ncbi:MAG: acyl-CoA dehydrogenase family protein [Candidatus Sericytochromatia bacterium]|uniref:Acyl-CoA dehydrogenase family protein n=1 Tax=Candidatus Tanganyikabacteria bacterium TaxID=2961651 RepID=A0A937X322_9BACT|nr:acyl-CoA dehydrogenase family protein [Candidatus Tanganyikabacteria bacterium]